ncbi:MAG: zf-HC2 domain-containing protein [Candidatus Firestonebacteria bacterium]
MVIKCADVKNNILDYINNEIDKVEREDISEHLKGCKDCRTKLLEYEEILKLSKSIKLKKPDEKFWINFLPNVRSRLEKKKNILNIFKPVIAFSCALIFLLIIFYPKITHKININYNYDENKIIERITTSENGLWTMLDEIYLKTGRIEEGLNTLSKEQREKILEELTLDYLQENI